MIYSDWVVESKEINMGNRKMLEVYVCSGKIFGKIIVCNNLEGRYIEFVSLWKVVSRS